MPLRLNIYGCNTQFRKSHKAPKPGSLLDAKQVNTRPKMETGWEGGSTVPVLSIQCEVQRLELLKPSCRTGRHGGLSITAASEVLRGDPQDKLESTLWS